MSKALVRSLLKKIKWLLAYKAIFIECILADKVQKSFLTRAFVYRNSD